MIGVDRVRALLARRCSADTMTRIVDPTLADACFEDGALTLRGWLALMRALAAHTVVSAPSRSVAIFADDAHAIPRLALLSAVAAVLIAVPLVIPPLWNG